MRSTTRPDRLFSRRWPLRSSTLHTASLHPGPRLAVFTLLTCWLAGFSLSAIAIVPTVATATPEPARSVGMAGMLQAGLGLIVVLALIFLCGWVARRFGLQQTSGNRLLKVISSVMVGTRERVVVVEIAGQWLVLGVAAGQVCALHSMPAASPPEASAMPAGNASARLPGAGSFSQNMVESLNRLKQQGSWR
jgi:flagellar protein FliO/FliZ